MCTENTNHSNVNLINNTMGSLWQNLVGQSNNPDLEESFEEIRKEMSDLYQQVQLTFRQDGIKSGGQLNDVVPDENIIARSQELEAILDNSNGGKDSIV